MRTTWCIAALAAWTALAGCLGGEETSSPPLVQDVAVEAQPSLDESLSLQAAAAWPLGEGLLRRYKVQATTWGAGVVEERVVEKTVVGGMSCWRIRALHRYDSGRTFVEEEYLYPDGPVLRTVARLATGGDFGRYDPPMVLLSAPMTPGTSWAGRSLLVEENRAGVHSSPVSLAWQGRVAARESVTCPAGRWEDVPRVEFTVDERWMTTLWLAPGIGVVRREIRDGADIIVLQELVRVESPR